MFERTSKNLRSSTAGWRQNLQPVSFPDLNHARNILLLLRTQRADFLEEAFEARRSDDAHQPARRLADVTVGVRYSARRENGRAFFGDEFFIAHGPFVFAFENL